jgi:hypothetical protein
MSMLNVSISTSMPVTQVAPQIVRFMHQGQILKTFMKGMPLNLEVVSNWRVDDLDLRSPCPYRLLN